MKIFYKGFEVRPLKPVKSVTHNTFFWRVVPYSGPAKSALRRLNIPYEDCELANNLKGLAAWIDSVLEQAQQESISAT